MALQPYPVCETSWVATRLRTELIARELATAEELPIDEAGWLGVYSRRFQAGWLGVVCVLTHAPLLQVLRLVVFGCASGAFARGPSDRSVSGAALSVRPRTTLVGS